MRKFFKIFSFFIFALILLFGGLLAFSQTGVFKNWIKEAIVENSAAIIDGDLQIGQLTGNLFTHIELRDILLTNEQDTVLFLPRFAMELSPSRFFDDEILIDSILIDSPYLNLLQAPDSSWNLNIQSESDTSAFPYRLIIPRFHLKDADINITALDTLAPKRIHSFDMRFSAIYSDAQQAFHLEKFHLKTEQPAIELQEFSFIANADKNQVSLQNLIIRTAKNRITGTGDYQFSGSENSQFQMKSAPIDFSEFREIFPAPRLPVRPEISLKGNYVNDRLNVTLDMLENGRGISLQSQVSNVSKALQDSTGASVAYSLKGKLSRFDAAHWSGDPTLDYLLNGTFEMSGSGFTPENAAVKMAANFSNSVFLKRMVSRLAVNADYREENLDSWLDVRGNFGKLWLKAAVADVNRSQKYKLRGELQQFNAAKLALNDSLQTDVNLKFTANGAGFDPKKMQGNVQLNLAPSTLLEIPVDTLFTSVKFKKDHYAIDTLHFGSPFARVAASGDVRMTGETDLRIRAQLKDLMALNHLIQADSICAAGEIAATVSGTMDSLQTIARLQLTDMFYDSTVVDSIQAKFSVLTGKDRVTGDGNVDIIRAGTPEMMIDSIRLTSDFTQDSASISADIVYQDIFHGKLDSRVFADSIPRVVIPNLVLDIMNRRWQGGSEDMQIALKDSAFQIDNFRLAAADSGGAEQTISANGQFSLTGAENLQLNASEIDLASLGKDFETPVDLGGTFSFSTDLLGTAEAPIILGKMGINNGSVNKLNYEINGSFDYARENFAWHFALIPEATDSVAITGYLPVNLSFTNEGDVLYSDRQLAVNLISKNFNLAALKPGLEIFKKLQGLIKSDLHLRNTIEDPKLSGFFKVEDGEFKVPEFGIDYNDFQLNVSLDSALFSIDTLQTRRDDGELRGSGYLEFDSSLISGNVKSLKMDFATDKFFLARHKDYEVLIDGDAHLFGNIREPHLEGDLSILRSSFYIPAFVDETETAEEAELTSSVPMLVAATRKTNASGDTSAVATHLNKTDNQNDFDFYKNLRSKFRVHIPKNTWLKSPEMRMEISGDLDLLKTGADFEVFGEIQVRRGHYELFGRRFNIKEGKLIFQGGTDYNPEIVLETQYTFRTPTREKKNLKLYMTNKVFNPVLKFTLDDAEINEGNAISYIMFGKSMDEMMQRQPGNAANQPADNTSKQEMLTGLAVNMLSAQLTKLVGNQMNLDIIEVKSEDNWQSASVVVGKYLTNDLFMSYQRGFGENQFNEVVPETVTLEYEFTKHLFLQLLEGDAKTSGMDVTLKFEF